MPGDAFGSWPDIAPPTFISPLDGVPITVALGFTIVLNPMVSCTQAQSSTDYQVTSGPGGTGTMIWSSMADVSALTTKVVPPGAVSAGTRYLRTRMNGPLKNSAWSVDKVLTVT